MYRDIIFLQVKAQENKKENSIKYTCGYNSLLLKSRNENCGGVAKKLNFYFVSIFNNPIHPNIFTSYPKVNCTNTFPPQGVG
jgi:hypothetical protein